MTVEHSDIIGGSSCERRMNCPGSADLEAKFPDRGSSKYADEGTMLHSVMHKILWEDSAPGDLIGYRELGQEFTEELLDELVQPALNCFDNLQDEYGEFEFTSEAKVGFPGTDGFGTCDLIGANDDFTFINDWKFGRGVKVKGGADNYQLRFYGAGAMNTPPYDSWFKPGKPIVLSIIQPAMREPLTHGIIEYDDLVEFTDEVQATIKKIMDGSKDFKAGKWCKWCRGQPVCPEKKTKAEELLGLNKSVLTPNELGFLVGQAEELEDFISSVKSLAREELEKGREVTGYKLVKKRATRSWADENRVVERLSVYLSKDQLFDNKLISPAKAEKAIKSAKADVEVKDLIVSRSSGTTMTTLDDEREAVVPKPGGDLNLPITEERLKHAN